MTDTVKTYKARGLSRSGGGDGDTEWVPLPPGRYTMQIAKCTLKDPVGPPRTDASGKEMRQYPRVVYQLECDEAAVKKVKAKAKLNVGQEQSTLAWFSANYTWGWFDRQEIFHPTKLFEFATDCAGFLAKADAKAWLVAGGELSPEWFLGMVFRGVVEHQPAKDGGRVWVTVTPQSLDDYEEDNRNALIAHLRDADAALFERLQEDPEAVSDEEVPF